MVRCTLELNWRHPRSQGIQSFQCPSRAGLPYNSELSHTWFWKGCLFIYFLSEVVLVHEAMVAAVIPVIMLILVTSSFPNPLTLIPPPSYSCWYQRSPRSHVIHRPRRCVCLCLSSCFWHVLLCWNCWPLFLRRFSSLAFLQLLSTYLLPPPTLKCPFFLVFWMHLSHHLLDYFTHSLSSQLSSISALSSRVTTGRICFLNLFFFILFYFIYLLISILLS